MEENQNQPPEAEKQNDASSDVSTLLTDEGSADGKENQTDSSSEDNSVEKKEEQKEEGAPEKYEFKQIEGAPIDSKVLDVFSLAAKELNLPQSKAQAMLDKVAPVMAARQQEQIKAVQAQWTQQSNADPEFGGEKLGENLGVAKKAFEQYATPEFKQMLNDTGLGNHPEVIRVFYRVGKTISEDGFVDGKSKLTGSKSLTDILYDKTKQGD